MNIELLAGLLFKTGKYPTMEAAREEAKRQAGAGEEPTLTKRFEPGRSIGGNHGGE